MSNIVLHKAPPGGELITKGTEAFNMIVQQYPVKYTLSEKRQRKYYIKPGNNTGIDPTKGLPLKHIKGLMNGTLIWAHKKKGNDKVECLYDTVSKEFVVKNSKAAGTPKIAPINGQDFWSGGDGQQWSRLKLKEFMYTYFASRITQQLPEGIWAPKGAYIQFEYIFYFPFSEYNANDIQDIDNHAYPYAKIFKDVLQSLNVIKGDDYRYVRGDYCHYIEVETEEERRLEIKVHFCDNEGTIVPRIYRINNPIINQYLETDPL